MSVPTKAELETIETQNREASLQQIPVSEKTIAEFKRYYEKIDEKEYTREQVLEFIKTGYNPEEDPKKKWKDNQN